MAENIGLLVDESTTTQFSGADRGVSTLPGLQDKAQRYPYENISTLEDEHFWFVVRNERICSLIQDTLPNYQTANFLEIGSGTGNVLGYLLKNGFSNLTGYEIEESGLEISKSTFPHINFEYNDLLDGSSKTAQFDAIGMFDCLEHFLDEREPLANVKAMLRPGGKFYLTVPAHEFLWSKIDELFGHYRRYTKKTLQSALIQNGFTDIQQAYFMAPLVPVAIIHRKLKKYPEVRTEREIAELLDKETSLPPRLVNEVMLYLTRLEHRMMGMKDLNFGGSILAVATYKG